MSDPAQAPAQPSILNDIAQNFHIVLIFGLMIYFMIASSRKEKKRKAEMVNSLKKDLKVQTIGGITGVIEEVRDDEVLLNVDAGSNTKITFTKSSIASIVNT